MPDTPLLPWCDLPTAYEHGEFRVKWAATPWEQRQAAALRQQVFCTEQRLFEGDDRDVIDTSGRVQTLVALACQAGETDRLAGTVRIHEAEDGLWWGSRLAVHADFRHHGRLGRALVRLAVTSARARGCHTFLAHVQRQNEPLFRRLHWRPLKTLTLHGLEHRLMAADLERHPPCYDPYSGVVLAPVLAPVRATAPAGAAA
jgi:putative N-acetyltransferase (TIGR04045 family)